MKNCVTAKTLNIHYVAKQRISCVNTDTSPVRFGHQNYKKKKKHPE